MGSCCPKCLTSCLTSSLSSSSPQNPESKSTAENNKGTCYITQNSFNEMKYVSHQKGCEVPVMMNEVLTQNWQKCLQDKRVFVQNCSVFPYDCIGLLYVVHCFGTACGTGFLIGDDLVLTVAHNLFWPQKQTILYHKMHFYPGAHGQLTDSFQVKDCRFPKSYHNTINGVTYDYALVKLSRKVVREKYLKLYQNFVFEQAEVLVSGYPNETQQIVNNMIIFKQLEDMARIKSIKNDILEHYASTTAGQSGSPILTTINEEKIVIALHKGAFPHCNYNAGPVIHSQMINHLKQWETQMSEQKNTPSQIYIYNKSASPPKSNTQFRNKSISQQEKYGIQSQKIVKLASFQEGHIKANLNSANHSKLLSKQSSNLNSQFQKNEFKTNETQESNFRQSAQLIKQKRIKQSESSELTPLQRQRARWQNKNGQRIKVIANQMQKESVVHLWSTNLDNLAMFQIVSHPISHIIELNLDKNNITAEGAGWLTSKSWNLLKILILTKNHIQHLKTCTPTNLPSLLVLNLGVNQLTDLPSNLLDFKLLKELYLYRNQFCKIPPVILEIKKKYNNLFLAEIYGNYINIQEQSEEEKIKDLIKHTINIGQGFKFGEEWHYSTQRKKIYK